MEVRYCYSHTFFHFLISKNRKWPQNSKTLRKYMKTKLITCILVALAIWGCRSKTNPSDTSGLLAIQSATLIDGRTGEAKYPVTILIENGRFTHIGSDEEVEIPDSAQIINAEGKWVMPGIVDVHTHIHEADTAGLRRFLAAGVTTIHTMPGGALPDDPAEWESKSQRSETPAPRVQVSPLFSAGFPDNLFPGAFPLVKPQTPEEARVNVRTFHKQGYRQIKIIQEDALPFVGEGEVVHNIDSSIYNALVHEAQSQGMRVYVHATQLTDTRQAVDAGVDAFMHGTMDQAVPEDLWMAMKRSGTVWTPSLRMLSGFGDSRRFYSLVASDSALHGLLMEDELQAAQAASSPDAAVSVPGLEYFHANIKSYFETLAANTLSAIEAGVPVAVGSDGGPPGVGTHIELEHMQEIGMSPPQVIVAATSSGALTLGLEDKLGVIEQGMIADLLILTADPTIDIRNSRHIEWVIKGGRIWSPQEMESDPGSP